MISLNKLLFRVVVLAIAFSGCSQEDQQDSSETTEKAEIDDGFTVGNGKEESGVSKGTYLTFCTADDRSNSTFNCRVENIDSGNRLDETDKSADTTDNPVDVCVMAVDLSQPSDETCVGFKKLPMDEWSVVKHYGKGEKYNSTITVSSSVPTYAVAFCVASGVPEDSLLNRLILPKDVRVGN